VELHNGALLWLDGEGKLVPVNLTAFRELIGQHICGMRMTPYPSICSDL